MPYQTVSQKENKAEIIANHKMGSTDTGSPEVQVALITGRINHLTAHLRENKNDFSTQRGLLKLVGQRKRLLTYLKSSTPKRYLDIIKKLELRK